MDLFAFASKSETQGMVLTEAMAAGLPVVALDASGVREVVRDKVNGRLLLEESPEAFAAALGWIAGCSKSQRAKLARSILKTARAFSMCSSATKAIGCYEALRKQAFVARSEAYSEWERLLHLIEAEWSIAKSMADAVGAGLNVGGAAGEPSP